MFFNKYRVTVLQLHVIPKYVSRFNKPTMAVSSILGIFMPMSIAVDPKCDYYQDVDVGQQYYIYNQQYPNRYPSGISCRWVAQSEPNTRMILTCEDIDIPKVRFVKCEVCR